MSSAKKQLGAFLFVSIVLYLSPYAGTLIADNYLSLFEFIDPDGVFFWGIIHHIVQALIPLAIILLWKGTSMKDWGFQVGDKTRGLKWVGWFSLIWIGIYLMITLFNICTQNTPQAYYDVTNTRNIFGELIFRGLIVGPSEEILFRAFPITVLFMAGFSKTGKIFGFNIHRAGIISAILFALAHVGVNFFPLEIYHFNFVQLGTSLGFGLLYAIVLNETKSIYYPILIHSISDVVPVLSLYIIHLV